MTSRGARTARGGLAAALAVFVSALAHDLSGGGAPPLLAVVVALAFAVPACVLLAGRRTSLWRLSVSVAFSQAVFHVLFTLGGGSGSTRFVMPAGHLHAGEHVGVVTTGGGSTALGAMSMGPAPLMWAGHALAALVTIAAIRRGEQTLLRLLVLATLHVVRAARLVLPAPLARPALPPHRVERPLRSVAERFRTLRHRGPPVALAL